MNSPSPSHPHLHPHPPPTHSHPQVLFELLEKLTQCDWNGLVKEAICVRQNAMVKRYELCLQHKLSSFFVEAPMGYDRSRSSMITIRAIYLSTKLLLFHHLLLKSI